jgi:hypothetical protein
MASGRKGPSLLPRVGGPERLKPKGASDGGVSKWRTTRWSSCRERREIRISALLSTLSASIATRWRCDRPRWRGRFLATVIVCAILLYFIWWIVGALAVVVLVVGAKVWQWSTAIRPPKPGG